jgi:hypothetical protein
VNKLWFDVPLQRQRIDIDVEIEDGKHKPERRTFLFIYPQAKWYEIVTNETTKTQTCTIHPLTGKLERLCLSKHARHRGSPLVGGVLVADNWIEEETRNETIVHVDILADRNVDVPIRASQRRDQHYSMEEFWNFEERVHHDAFIVPDVCTSRPKIARGEPKTWQNVYRNSFPNGYTPVVPRA